MTRVIAAVDNSLTARPVLATGRRLADLLGAVLEALHVREDGERLVRTAAGALEVELHVADPPVVPAIRRAAEEPDVVALVLGSRRTPGGRRPAGTTALAVLTVLPKPVAVVPPDTPRPDRLERVLVPLEGTPETSTFPDAVAALARLGGVEVVVMHVREEESLPLFTDQLQHETLAWTREFLARHCPVPPRDVRFEVRVGRSEDAIVAGAAETGADLIVLGWQQELAEGRARVVRATLERCAAPVLLFPVHGRVERRSAA